LIDHISQVSLVKQTLVVDGKLATDVMISMSLWWECWYWIVVIAHVYIAVMMT